MTVSPSSARKRRATGAPGRRWWVLGAVFGGLLVAVPLMVSRPAITTDQVGAATAAVRPHRVSRRRRWGLGAVLGVLAVAVTLVAAAPFTTTEHVVPARTAAAAPIADAEAATTPTSVGVASLEIPAAGPSAVPKIAPGGTTSPVTAPVAPTESRTAEDAAPGTSDPTPSALPGSDPTRVRIPAIDLDSDLVALGLESDGSMEVPPGAFPAGWYTGAPTPGELGPAVLAGHVDYGGSAGVFSRLGDLEAGDTVEVTRQDGSTAVFRVTRVEQHDKDAFPTTAVYGDIDHAGLRLITCGGPFDRRVNSYEDNVVVFAELDTRQA